MKFLATVILASAFLYGCQESDTATTADDKDNGRLVFETGEIVFDQDVLQEVCFEDEGFGRVVMVSLTEAGAAEMSRLTGQNLNGEMSLVHGGKTYFTAVIRDQISGTTPIAMSVLSDAEESLAEMSEVFGVPEIAECQGPN